MEKLTKTFEDSAEKMSRFSDLTKSIVNENGLDSLIDSVLEPLKVLKDEILLHYIEASIWQAFSASVRQRAKDLLGSDS